MQLIFLFKLIAVVDSWIDAKRMTNYFFLTLRARVYVRSSHIYLPERPVPMRKQPLSAHEVALQWNNRMPGSFRREGLWLSLPTRFVFTFIELTHVTRQKRQVSNFLKKSAEHF